LDSELSYDITYFEGVPREWGIKTLESVLSLIKDGTHNPPKRYKNGIKFIAGATNVKYLNIDFTNCTYISESDYEKIHKFYKIQPDDILLTIVGTIGNVAIVKKSDLPFSMQRSIALLRCGDSLHYKFLFYWLTSEMFKRMLYANVNPTAQPGIYLGVLKQLKIPLPSLREQQAIAKILSDLDEKIELNDQMNKTLENIAQAIFKRWFIDFEFPNENGEPYKTSGGEMVESELGMIPKGWEISTLGDYGELKNGINYLRSESGDAEFFIVNVRNIVNNKLILKNSLDKIKIDLNKAKSYFLMDKDILIARSASPGEVSLVLGNLQNIIYSGFSIRYRLKRPDGYLYMFLVMQKLKEQLSSFSVGTTLQSINQETLKKMKFILPSIEVLNRFNVMAGYILEKTYINLIENYSLSQIRDLLLPKLMTGKIRVPLEEQNV